jgi:HK97 family phage major capsid protein
MPERKTSALGPGHNPTTSYIVPTTGPAAGPDVASVRPATKRDYFSLFPHAPRTLEGFRSAGEFFDAIGYGQSHPAFRCAMSGLSGGAGGFIVPAPIAAAMWNDAVAESVLLSRVTLYPMESQTLRVAAWDEDTTTDTSMAGFTLEFLGELETATRSTGKMRSIQLNAHKAGIFVQASMELVNDGQSFEAQLTSKLREALSRGIDSTLLRGDGAAKPLGALNAPCTVSVPKETNQTAATVKYENVVKMFSRLLPGSLKNAIWLAHPSTLPELLSMTLGVGAAGVWMPAMDQSTGSLTLLSRPVILTEQCSALGTVGDIILIDPTAIVCGVRQEISIERSNAPGWLESAIDWRCLIRIDAQPALSAAHQGPRGSTLSPIVTLATRS